MNDVDQQFDARQDRDPAQLTLERIPSPFVWAPSRPAKIRVAVVGGESRRAAGTTKTLRASGHLVTSYASANALVEHMQRQPRPLDVAVLHFGGSTTTIVAALELLRAKCRALPIVLIAEDDADVLAECKRLSVEEVLEPPVHPVALRAAVAAATSPRAGDLAVNLDSWNL